MLRVWFRPSHGESYCRCSFGSTKLRMAPSNHLCRSRWSSKRKCRSFNMKITGDCLVRVIPPHRVAPYAGQTEEHISSLKNMFYDYMIVWLACGYEIVLRDCNESIHCFCGSPYICDGPLRECDIVRFIPSDFSMLLCLTFSQSETWDWENTSTSMSGWSLESSFPPAICVKLRSFPKDTASSDLSTLVMPTISELILSVSYTDGHGRNNLDVRYKPCAFQPSGPLIAHWQLIFSA